MTSYKINQYWPWVSGKAQQLQDRSTSVSFNDRAIVEIFVGLLTINHALCTACHNVRGKIIWSKVNVGIRRFSTTLYLDLLSQISTHAFHSPWRNIRPRKFFFPQNLSIDTCLGKWSSATTISLIRCKNFGYDLFLWFLLTKSSLATCKMREWKPGCIV